MSYWRDWIVGAAFGLEAAADGVVAAGAAGEAVDCLGREHDQFAFRQRLHGPVHDVAAIVGFSQVDDDGRHRQTRLPTARRGARR